MNIEATHTPGPWYFDKEGTSYCVSGEDSAHWIAEYVRVEADARLIAAAPDLLKALEAIVEAHDRDGYETRQFAIELILMNGGRAAITKATS